MAELSPKERLQPSLLDRLTDDEPDQTRESRDKRVLSLRQLRASVLRDLGWLLNTVNLAAVEDLEDWPLIERSVVNYGIPDLAGHTASNVDFYRLEQMLAEAVRAFEPRILPHTVQVQTVTQRNEIEHNAVAFEIRGMLWAQPAPLALVLQTELDLETGEAQVLDQSWSGTA